MVPPPCGPVPAPTVQSGEATITKQKSMSQAELQEANGPELDPLIDALLAHLPASGDYFPPDDRALWLQILELALKLIYTDKPPQDGSDGGGDV